MAAIPVIAAIYVLQVMEPPMSADRVRGPNTRPLDTDWWHSNLLLCVLRPVTPTRGPMNSLCPVCLREGLKNGIQVGLPNGGNESDGKKDQVLKTHGREPFRAECRLTIHIACQCRI